MGNKTKHRIDRAPTSHDHGAASDWLAPAVEGLRFATHRFEQNLIWQKASLASRSPTEFWDIQRNYLKTALWDYSDEFARLRAQTLKASDSIFRRIRSVQSRGYDDVPL